MGDEVPEAPGPAASRCTGVTLTVWRGRLQEGRPKRWEQQLKSHRGAEHGRQTSQAGTGSSHPPALHTPTGVAELPEGIRTSLGQRHGPGLAPPHAGHLTSLPSWKTHHTHQVREDWRCVFGPPGAPFLPSPH